MLTAISRFGKTKAPCRLEVGGVLLDCVPVELSDCRVVFVITRAASKAKTPRTKVTPAQAIGPPAAMLEWSVTLENITLYRGARGAHQPKLYDVRLCLADPGDPRGRPGAVLATFKLDVAEYRARRVGARGARRARRAARAQPRARARATLRLSLDVHCSVGGHAPGAPPPGPTRPPRSAARRREGRERQRRDRVGDDRRRRLGRGAGAARTSCARPSASSARRRRRRVEPRERRRRRRRRERARAGASGRATRRPPNRPGATRRGRRARPGTR